MIRAGIIGSTGYAGGELVRILLGHKDVEITARIYVHNELHELRKALRWMQRRSPIISGGAA